MGWWHTGTDQAKKEQEDKIRRSAGGRRFFLKVGESRKIVFLEDIFPSAQGKFWPERTFCCYEHELELDNDFKKHEFVTCVRGFEKEFGPCAVCQRKWQRGNKEQPFQRMFRSFITIADLTPWERDDGSLYVVSKRILAVKGESFDLLAGKAAKKRNDGDPDGLKMWLADVSRISQMKKSEKNGRTQEMAPRVGNDFELIGKVLAPPKLPPLQSGKPLALPDGRPHPGLIQADGKPLDLSPFNWPEVLKPRSKEEVEAIFSGHYVTDGSVKSFGAKPQPSGSATAAGGQSGGDEEVAY